jgi:hypothetical protein
MRTVFCPAKPHSCSMGVAVLCLVSMLVFTGCFSARVERDAKELTGDTAIPLRELQNQAVAAAFFNESVANQNPIESDFQRYLAEDCARSCSEFLFQNRDLPSFTEFEGQVVRTPSGQIDGYVLAMGARKQGVAAVITGAVTVIRKLEDTIGIWWFERPLYLLAVHTNVSVYDSETGAKIMSEDYEEQVEIPKEQFDAVGGNDWSGSYPYVDDALALIGDELGGDVCAVLKDQSFKAYLSAAEAGRVVLTSGAQAGISVGNEFGVYDSSTVITGKGGARYIGPGTQVGVVKIVSVSDRSAEGEVVSGEVPNDLACLKLIKN